MIEIESFPHISQVGILNIFIRWWARAFSSAGTGVMSVAKLRDAIISSWIYPQHSIWRGWKTHADMLLSAYDENEGLSKMGLRKNRLTSEFFHIWANKINSHVSNLFRNFKIKLYYNYHFTIFDPVFFRLWWNKALNYLLTNNISDVSISWV